MKEFFVIAFLTGVYSVLADEVLLHHVKDRVSAGAYKYYSLVYGGRIKLTLISTTGDADLYASQTTTKPSYEPERYCLQSVTCGEDSIVIPESYEGPVNIGVYGHPAHETSDYSLLVYRVTANGEEYADRPELSSAFDENNTKRKSLILTFLWNALEHMVQVLF